MKEDESARVFAARQAERQQYAMQQHVNQMQGHVMPPTRASILCDMKSRASSVRDALARHDALRIELSALELAIAALEGDK
jgi:hypothetical protein